MSDLQAFADYWNKKAWDNQRQLFATRLSAYRTKTETLKRMRIPPAACFTGYQHPRKARRVK